jgi:hypothetical protein
MSDSPLGHHRRSTSAAALPPPIPTTKEQKVHPPSDPLLDPPRPHRPAAAHINLIIWFIL